MLLVTASNDVEAGVVSAAFRVEELSVITEPDGAEFPDGAGAALKLEYVLPVEPPPSLGL